MPTPESFDVTILRSEDLAPKVRSFLLERTDGKPLRFEPGQWVNLFLPLAGGELKRAYSIASAPDGSPRFELAVTEVVGGPGSGFLCGLGAGAVLRAGGPQGFFVRRADDPSPALFVGTGTGITPLRSMLRAAVAAHSEAQLWVLLGVRHEVDLIYRAELEELAGQHDNVRVFFTLSRPPEPWTGHRGYVQAHVPELWRSLGKASPHEAHLFVCGLEDMVSAVRSLARTELGVPRERVHAERYD